MKKPTHVEYNVDNQTSILWIEGKPKEYYMRGGICWPMTVERGGVQDVFGHAVMAGFDIKTGEIRVFEEREWVVVHSILNKDHHIEFEGLAPWLRKLWSEYFALDFFWHQSKVLTKSYRLEVFRSDVIQPKPSFTHIDWSDDEAALHTLWKHVKLKTLITERPSAELLRERKYGEKQILPAIHALQCLVEGLERYPYRGE